jgi:prolycopene isomerase
VSRTRALRDSSWDVVVVGAGLGGLAAAAALSRRGRRVLVLEQHDVPGGYAHRFLRRARGQGGAVYAFDVALHQIGGLAPDRRLHQQLRDLGVLARVRLRRFDAVYRTRGPAHDLLVSADLVRYQRDLGAMFPAHRAGIDALLRRLREVDMGARSADETPAAAVGWLGRPLSEVVRAHVPDDRFLAIFTPLWAYVGRPPADLDAFTFAQVWACYHVGGCYYVAGGGQALSDAFVGVIEAAGGQVLLRAPVTEILTAGGRACGVATRRHGRVNAPVVISNASAPDTFQRLLGGGAAADPRASAGEAPARHAPERVPGSTSIVEAYVGMRGRAEERGLRDRLIVDLPTYDLDAQWQAVMRGDPRGAPVVLANHNLSDPDGVPPGRSILNAAVLADGGPWMALDDADYRFRKRELEEYLVDRLAAEVTDLRADLEIVETGTPRTMARYSWNPAGAIYGVAASPRHHPLRRPRPRTSVPGLYLAGAWTFPAGGFHGAITSGLHTATLVLSDLGVRAGNEALPPLGDPAPGPQ